MVDDEILSLNPFGYREDDPPREYFEDRGFGIEHTEAANDKIFDVEQTFGIRSEDGENGALSLFAFSTLSAF